MSNEPKFELGQEVTLKGVIKAVKTNNDDSVYCLVDIEGIVGAELAVNPNSPAAKAWVNSEFIHPAASVNQFATDDVVKALDGTLWTVAVDTQKERYHLTRVNEHGETIHRVWSFQVGHEYFTKV